MIARRSRAQRAGRRESSAGMLACSVAHNNCLCRAHQHADAGDFVICRGANRNGKPRVKTYIFTWSMRRCSGMISQTTVADSRPYWIKSPR